MNIWVFNQGDYSTFEWLYMIAAVGMEHSMDMKSRRVPKFKTKDTTLTADNHSINIQWEW